MGEGIIDPILGEGTGDGGSDTGVGLRAQSPNMGEFVFFLHVWYCLVFCFKRISLGWVLFCLRGLELLANLDEDCRHSLEHFIIMSYGGLHLNIREQQI